ncbi:ribonuclease H-like domain-containing protein [Tanacetum coccineum]
MTSQRGSQTVGRGQVWRIRALRSLQRKTTNGAPSSSIGQCKVVNVDHETLNIPISSSKLNNLHGVSFLSDSDSQVTQNNKERTTEVLQCKLPPKEQNLGNFTLPCTIGNFNFYAMADLGASVNVMPRGIFEFLKLTNLRKTNMLIEVADMTKKAPLGVVENILVGIDKFLFPSDFVIINRTPNETIILGRPFLATIHAKIHVFNKEISLGVGNDRIMFDMEKKDPNFMIPTEKILMMNSISNNEPSFPPGNPSSKSLKTDNLQDRQEQHVKKKLRLDEYIPVKYLCKPIMQTYNGKARMWPTLKEKNMKGVGLSFPDFLLVRYGGCQLNDLIWEQSYAEWYKENSHDNKPRPRDYTFKEWMIVKVGHTDVNKSIKKALLKSWVIDCFEEALDPDKDPMERSFDDYQWVFDLEIEQLADEYELGIGKKGHILECVGKYIVKDLILNSDNSYLRDILGDILGKDMHYPFTRFVKPFKVSLIQTRGPTSGIRANRGTLSKKNHLNHKQTLTFRYLQMSQPANDEFSQHLSDDEASNHEDASDTGAALHNNKVISQSKLAIINIKILISKEKWIMETPIREFQLERMGVLNTFHSNCAAEIQVVEKERKAKNILLMAIPKEHMRRFHGMDDAKEIWEAIRTRFGGNANSKKMQKALEAHGAEVSTEDANHKFLRSLPPAWSNLAMTMRTKPDVDTLSIDDLYNNLRVFEQEIQGASKTFSSAQNVAFVSQSKSSTNKVKSGFTGAYSTCTPSTSSTNTPEKEALAGFADEVIYSLFAKQSEDWDLLHEDLEQIDDLDIEEMDIMAKGTHDGKKKRDSFYQHQEAGKQEKNQMGLLTMDDGIVNWGEHTKDEETNHALMAISSSSECKIGLEKDSVGKPLYSRFTKTNDFKGVPHLLSGDYTLNHKKKLMSPRCMFMIKRDPKSLKPSVSDDRSSEYSTCQSNDSAGSIRTSSVHSVDLESKISRVPQEVYVSKHTTTQMKKGKYSSTKKKCFVCGSLCHLIKDCDYYEKKMAREAGFKKQRVFNTGNMVAKPVWTNDDRINHDNQFVPRLVQLNAGRPNINSVRPNINTDLAKNTAQMSHSHAVKGNWGSAVKTSAGIAWICSCKEVLISLCLRKPDESAGFAEIVDFLRGSNLRYALTTNPTIYDSLVKQFGRCYMPKLLADGLLELKQLLDTIVGQEALSITQPQPSSRVVPPTPPITQPIPSEATTILPLSQPAPLIPIAETTTASPSPTPSPCPT